MQSTSFPFRLRPILIGATLTLLVPFALRAEVNVYIEDMPAYEWMFGCFGTSLGIHMAWWDRHGLADVYPGATAPLSNKKLTPNEVIRAMWATEAGFAGRAADNYGHVDDYYVAYENEGTDPWHARGVEHEPDCIGDFIGLNQNTWTNLNNECKGNRDAWAFNYFDATGARRVNYRPSDQSGGPHVDIQSGLRDFLAYRGYTADTFSQLVDVWGDTPAGTGFTFEDVQREIDSGYPIQMMLQQTVYARPSGFNPDIHSVVIAGYRILDNGSRQIRARKGWNTNPASWELYSWDSANKLIDMRFRGVIGVHPHATISSVTRTQGLTRVAWRGPGPATVYNAISGAQTHVHWYVAEYATTIEPATWVPLGPSTTSHSIDVADPGTDAAFFRVRHLEQAFTRDAALKAALSAAVVTKYDPATLLWDIDVETIPSLDVSAQGITDLDGLQYALGLTSLTLDSNSITDLGPLVENADQGGLGAGDTVSVLMNPLSTEATTVQIPALQSYGVTVLY